MENIQQKLEFRIGLYGKPSKVEISLDLADFRIHAPEDSWNLRPVKDDSPDSNHPSTDGKQWNHS